ncbi:hypothetical protein [Nocardia brasiliensis]|uniref:hypothetical protein n=1 Tax=Nocardia brasiliensis TaxID=37326 RepID=UPI0033F9F699
MTVAKLHYGGETHTLDLDFVEEFVANLRTVFDNDHDREREFGFITAKLVGGKSVMIAVSRSIPIAVWRSDRPSGPLVYGY